MRILYIDADSLRPDHLGCYGYHRDTSPHIDALAAESTRFTNVYASDSPCLPSRTALWSGRSGFLTGVVGHGGTAAQPFNEGAQRGFRDSFANTSWMSCLHAVGLRTVTVSSFAARHAAWHWLAGFDEVYNTGERGMETADTINRFALDWIARSARNDNWFLHLNYWDPHTPYRTPMDYGNPFADEPIEAWYTQAMLDRCLRSYGPHSALEPHHQDQLNNWRDFPRLPQRIDSLAAVKQWVDGYDVGVHYMDDHIGAVLNALREAGVYDDLIIIVSADHGENLGELNVWGDHQTADHCTNRVPLIVRYPGISKGAHIDDGLHYQFDWAATLIELVGGVVPANWQGRSFADAIRTHRPAGRDYLVLGHNAWSCQRSVRFEQCLCIRTYHDGLKDFPQIMLFDVDRDPHQQHNLADQHPELVARAMVLLSDWEHDMKCVSDHETDPMMTVLREGGPFHVRGRASEYIARLEALGAHAQADALRARHGGEQ
jgi:arylsulfatase A-like enzyme